MEVKALVRMFKANLASSVIKTSQYIDQTLKNRQWV